MNLPMFHTHSFIYFLFWFPCFTRAGCRNSVCSDAATVQDSHLIQINENSDPPGLTPVGRSYLSSNAELTAEFFRRIFNAENIEQNVTYTDGCAKSVSLKWAAGIVLTFVEYEGDSKAGIYIDALEWQWQAMATGQMQYSRWIDNHDGFHIRDEHFFNLDNLLQETSTIQTTLSFTRIRIPKTYWNVEVSGNLSALAVAKLPLERAVDVAFADTKCRVSIYDSSQAFSNLFWWKTTFASDDPEAAADFTQHYFMANRWQSEYPDTYNNCTLSEWMVLPGSEFQLHFARTEPCEIAPPSVSDWVKHQEETRDLGNNIFDQDMMSHLTLWTESLDPFVERLRDGKQPFIALKLSNDVFDVFVSVPKNAMVFRLRSHELKSVEPAGTYTSCS